MKKANLMTRQLEAIFQDGVLRPLQPLSLLEDQKVLVTITIVPTDLAESDYLDTELHRYCEARADSSITLEQVRKSWQQSTDQLLMTSSLFEKKGSDARLLS
ncbi:MAG: antitoxin family protein [Acidobacteria bacterium]|nr:antitoxin family protein [Acidobacteriota bacterium]